MSIHPGAVAWLTGLPGSGKSTLAQHLARELAHRGIPHLVLDGDVVRRGLCSDLAFDRSDRSSVSAAGIPFVEVFVDAPLAVCERRDPKGLYARSRAGTVPRMTGISAPYEPPDSPDVHVRTHLMDVDECTQLILTRLLPLVGNGPAPPPLSTRSL